MSWLVEPTQSARTSRLPLQAPSKIVALEFFQESIAQGRLIDRQIVTSVCQPETTRRIDLKCDRYFDSLLTEIFVRKVETQSIACAPPIPGVKPWARTSRGRFTSSARIPAIHTPVPGAASVPSRRGRSA